MSGPPSPFDAPIPRGFPVVLATLRISVALMCWGWAGGRLSTGDDLALERLLIEGVGLTEALTETLLDRAAWALAAAGLLTLFRPCWPVLFPVTVWFAVVAAAGLFAAGDAGSLCIHSTRVVTPWALLLLDFWPPHLRYSLGRGMFANFCLRAGTVLMLTAYGWQSWQQSQQGGPLMEILSRVSRQVLGLEVNGDEARLALGVLGGIEVGLALALLLVRSRAVAFLIVCWGVTAAMSSVVAVGPAAWHLVLLQAPDAGAPCALGLHWLLAVKEQPAVTLPAGK